MNTELMCLTVVSMFTGVLYVPYVLNRLMVGPGLVTEVGYPVEATKLSPWADRLKRSHANSVENLVVFAPLVLAAHAAGISTPLTAMASMVYVGARVVYVLVYTFAVPWLRTLAFTVGWGCQVALAWALLVK